MYLKYSVRWDYHLWRPWIVSTRIRFFKPLALCTHISQQQQREFIKVAQRRLLVCIQSILSIEIGTSDIRWWYLPYFAFLSPSLPALVYLNIKARCILQIIYNSYINNHIHLFLMCRNSLLIQLCILNILKDMSHFHTALSLPCQLTNPWEYSNSTSSLNMITMWRSQGVFATGKCPVRKIPCKWAIFWTTCLTRDIVCDIWTSGEDGFSNH
jgi:hypothetical protein